MTASRATAVGAMIVAGIATLWALHWAEAVLVPFALAAVLAIALRPGVRLLERWRVPSPAGALVAVIACVGAFFVTGSILADPVRAWSARVPDMVQAAVGRIEPLRRRLDRFAAGFTPAGQAASSSSSSDQSRDSTVVANGSSTTGPSAGTIVPIAGRIFGSSARLLGGITETILLLFFLLAAGDRWGARLGPGSGPGSRAILHEVGHVVSRFLGTMLLINLAQGVVIAVAMAVIGMPEPILWGVLTVVAELAPYVGAATMITLLLLTGLAGQGHGIQPFVAPAIYLVVAIIQTNVVGPLVYGQGLKLNPVAILLSLMLWWFLWGVPGAFLAVPILAAMKVVCDRVPALARPAALISD